MSEQEPNVKSNREAIIEHSRQQYALPREEVEQQIAQQMGWPSPDEEKRKLKLRLLTELMKLGVSEHEASSLLERYSTNRIEQQLSWLPYRTARKPSALIVAAIRRNFDPPSALFPATDRDNSQTTTAASSDRGSSEQKTNRE